MSSSTPAGSEEGRAQVEQALAKLLWEKMEHLDPTVGDTFMVVERTWDTADEHEREFCHSCINHLSLFPDLLLALAGYAPNPARGADRSGAGGAESMRDRAVEICELDIRRNQRLCDSGAIPSICTARMRAVSLVIGALPIEESTEDGTGPGEEDRRG